MAVGEVKYHRDIYFPKGMEEALLSVVVRRNGTYRLGFHAANRAKDKGVRLPALIPIQKCEVIEVTMIGGKVQKFLLRFPQDEQWDICLSYMVDGFVPTVWLNQRSDAHATLDRRKYNTR